MSVICMHHNKKKVQKYSECSDHPWVSNLEVAQPILLILWSWTMSIKEARGQVTPLLLITNDDTTSLDTDYLYLHL